MKQLDFKVDCPIPDDYTEFEGRAYKTIGAAKGAARRIMCDWNAYHADHYSVLIISNSGGYDVYYKELDK